jgi:hypothetical protein
MKFYRLLFFLLFFAGANNAAFCQHDTLKIAHDTIIAKKKPASLYGDSAMIHGKMRKHDPKVASTRSAILPGWGQIYNRSYWKLPIIYGALGITTYVFIDNMKTVRAANYAIKYMTPEDSAGTNYEDIAPYLKPFVDNGDVNSLRNVRNQYRQYVDYAALVFILFWGLNVVDATVDAHLKHFDVSDDLSMKIKPNFVPQVGGQTFGVSLVFDIHKGKTALRGLP